MKDVKVRYCFRASIPGEARFKVYNPELEVEAAAGDGETAEQVYEQIKQLVHTEIQKTIRSIEERVAKLGGIAS